MIVITGGARVAAANRAEFEKVAERQVRLSRKEPGNVSYAYFEDRMEPGRFFFHEEWKDRPKAAFDSREEEWIASSLSLLAMTERRTRPAAPPSSS